MTTVILPIERPRVLGNRATASQAVFPASLRVTCQPSGLVPLANVLFDTGTHLSTLPLKFASDNGIPFSKASTDSIQIRGTTGTSRKVHIGHITYRFKEFPYLEFSTLCAFNPHIRRPLWSLHDVEMNFFIKHLSSTQHAPFGALQLDLRSNHQGKEVLPIPPLVRPKVSKGP